ncbi:coiled-coil alpha-helical rod protein 1-like [Physella acuta]|uniref:coiled-coil alpha-helical rod protein 1-like n=1 Tax=Physella acuta TaxID=109671 RepID=UPI0027DD8F45|nr:coiled-coil alpha-helical rod protein 1-like [Physella acuta]
MAANMNKPDDFMITRLNLNNLQGNVLLPPSEFEKPLVSHTELEVMKKQIKQLEQENKKIKLLQDAVPHSNQIQALPIALPHNEYADELIKRQAGEITDLRAELMKLGHAYNQEVSDLEQKMDMMANDHQKEVKMLEKQLEKKEDELDQTLSRLSSELQRTQEDTSRELLQVNKTLESTRASLSARIMELEETLTSVQKERDKTVAQLEFDLRNKSRTIKDQAHQIGKLKTYIGETEQTHKPAQLWRVEKETVDNKLKLALAEKEKLQSELQLLDVRFKALSHILAIQETELSKAKDEGHGQKKQHSLLVTRWREKVFALLVQQKSSELVHRNDCNNTNLKLMSLAQQLDASQSQVEMLKLSLTEKSAQLQMELNNKERLEQELDQVNKVAVCLDDQSQDSQRCVMALVEFVQSNQLQMEEKMKILEEKSKVLKTMCQRISFATSRMELLKAQLMRKSAFSISLDEPIQPQSSPADKSENYLCQELEKVMKERDLLALQVEEDSTRWTQRLTEFKNSYAVESSSLKKTVEELELDVQQKSKMCSHLTEELHILREENQEKTEIIVKLKKDLDRHAKGLETVLGDQRLKDEAVWQEKLSELERKLNDSKREHAKAVISLRQMERNHRREVERAKELLETTEKHLNSQLQQLQVKLLSTEKERNIMMATLRQEGLIGQLKTERGEPYRLQDSSRLQEPNDTDLYQPEDHKEHQDFHETDLETSENVLFPDKDNLHTSVQKKDGIGNVLEDLKSLTAVIFSDGEEDDTSDEHNF